MGLGATGNNAIQHSSPERSPSLEEHLVYSNLDEVDTLCGIGDALGRAVIFAWGNLDIVQVVSGGTIL